MAILLPLALGVLGLVFYFRKVGSREPGLPPGPPTIPLLGNLHIFPTEFSHFKFTEWARQYGGIYSLKVGPGTAIVLTDVADVKELMDKRSALTADRPQIHIADIVTEGLNMGVAHYTDKWKLMRKTAHAILTPAACNRHLPIQRAEAVQLLHDLLRHPKSFYTDISRYASSVTFSVLYGNRAPRFESPGSAKFFKAQHEWECLLEPGAAPPVDMIPILKWVPERFAKWKRDAKKTRQLQREVYFGLLDETRDRLAKGEENGSYMEEVLKRKDELGLDYETIGYLGGALIEGGLGSTSSYLQAFIMTMVAYPEAQKRAQEEIDRVVGQDRMPTLDDFDQMPFVRGITWEMHRFRPVAPLMIPHGSLAPMEYKGYFIPEGATILINAWGIFHDPELYDDPDNFRPERYVLTENGAKPGAALGSDLRANFAFGAGRRFCPGIHLGQNSININVMNLLWAFDFKEAIDEAGKPIKLNTLDYHKGILSVPKEYKCQIIPRTPEKAEMIERETVEATPVFEKFEMGLGPEDKEFLTKLRATLHKY